ncbi:MAG: tyrosine-type recombinase/integrase [Ectothiorhodospira sp.]
MKAEGFERYLTAEEQKRLLAAARRVKCPYAERDEAWMRLMLNTGIRVGAMSRLTVGDARVAIAERRLILRAEIQKGGRGHAVPLNRKAEQALRDLLANRKHRGLHNEDLEAPLVAGQRGGMSVRTLQARFKLWAQEAGLPKGASPHWLRHTVAKRVMATSTAENPLGVVQRVLGHRSIASTGVYTAPDKETIRQSMEGL